MPPPTPPPEPKQPEVMADDDYFEGAGGSQNPSDLLQFDDLLDSVDFDDPARAARRTQASVPTESTIHRIPRPLSAWPMGAG